MCLLTNQFRTQESNSLMWAPWLLQRSPLAASVPLEGTDTVEGLRQLERRHLAGLLPPLQVAAGNGDANTDRTGWRQPYQRYRGPHIEQLTCDDLQQPPKSWTLFWKGSEQGQAALAYSVPASLHVLCERTEENLVSFLPNYVRLALGVLLATFYLRPKALLGAVPLAFSIVRSARQALRRQQRQLAAAAAASEARNPRLQQAFIRAAAAEAVPAESDDQAATAALTLVTWVAVAYSRCLPVLLLGLLAGLVAVLLHCGLRRAPSEYRYKGRLLLGYSWRQVLGQDPVPLGSDPRAVFKELAAAGRQVVARQWLRFRLYCRYYWLTSMDSWKYRRSR